MAKTKDSKDIAATVSEDSISEERKPSAEEVRDMLTGKNREHMEALGLPWGVLLGADPAKMMSQVVATCIAAGGTRPAWRWTQGDTEFVLMAWPKDQPVRASVLMAGKVGENLRPIDAVPLIEGLPNDLNVEEVHPWESGSGANVGAIVEDGRNPMWFYDPLYERDQADLTPGVTQTFAVAGLAFSLRKALLDELTITQGPQFEAHAANWLNQNPDKTRLDVPPLSIPLRGRRMIMPGRNFCEYQIRAVIERIDDCQLEQMKVKILYASFPFENRPNLVVPIYVSSPVLKDYEPKVGDEFDAYVWLQGRVIDFEPEVSSDTPEHVNPLQ